MLNIKNKSEKLLYFFDKFSIYRENITHYILVSGYSKLLPFLCHLQSKNISNKNFLTLSKVNDDKQCKKSIHVKHSIEHRQKYFIFFYHF